MHRFELCGATPATQESFGFSAGFGSCLASGAEAIQREQAPGWHSDTAPFSTAGEAGSQKQPLEVRAAKAQVKQGSYL